MKTYQPDLRNINNGLVDVFLLLARHIPYSVTGLSAEVEAKIPCRVFVLFRVCFSSQ